MQTTVARLLTRFQGEGDGLILGALFKSGVGHFKPNSIYEIVYCSLSDEIKIKYRGPSCIAGEGETIFDSPIKHHWAEDVNSIISTGGEIFLTPGELLQVRKQEEAEYLKRMSGG